MLRAMQHRRMEGRNRLQKIRSTRLLDRITREQLMLNVHHQRKCSLLLRNTDSLQPTKWSSVGEMIPRKTKKHTLMILSQMLQVI
ncbi:hypothetical protein OESDEN_04038 [Oesophagostomum dentatum]|uniref:Uncharacterized protein n=1 Tax=Oesophagostomum dentatum TaxID=61180 RepID=A0A0B1TJL0_OESDE|nr:hypothetical protein OESDEN_04038 [Oesophagostomum dentatum]